MGCRLVICKKPANTGKTKSAFFRHISLLMHSRYTFPFPKRLMSRSTECYQLETKLQRRLLHQYNLKWSLPQLARMEGFCQYWLRSRHKASGEYSAMNTTRSLHIYCLESADWTTATDRPPQRSVFCQFYLFTSRSYILASVRLEQICKINLNTCNIALFGSFPYGVTGTMKIEHDSNLLQSKILFYNMSNVQFNFQFCQAPYGSKHSLPRVNYNNLRSNQSKYKSVQNVQTIMSSLAQTPNCLQHTLSMRSTFGWLLNNCPKLICKRHAKFQV